ncbi:MAG: pyruvate kinase [Candidatus Omnitrophota bacterium]
MVKTKIICTIGPASSSETILRKMIFAGMDVCRLNFSHGDPEGFAKKIRLIRLLNRKYRRRIKILGDLQGHRVRIGGLSSPVNLRKRQILWLIQKKIKPAPGKVYFDYQGPLSAIKSGFHVFIDDGNIDLEVIGRAKAGLKTRVASGGLLKAHKGVNIPEARLEFGAISREDKRDILFCERNNVEYIAQSFARSKKDIMEVKGALGPGSACRVIAKIEDREGIKNIDDIIKVSDGIMIARGDMGVSIPVYEVPLIQKEIIKKCNKAGKVVITATQMLESMTENRTPTRAEVSDVANAILDGTDYVMLSAETAAGKYPVESVDMMNRIIKFTERRMA